MNGLCITDAVKQFGVTSKTLRYYERVGLLEAKRADNNNYRYYDESEIERIKQIMILRKMHISIKDIIRIYENEDMSTVVEVFLKRINAIDEEVGALNELKRITNDFLQTMLNNGVTKISVLPILYEQMEKQLETQEKRKTTSYTEFSALSDKLTKPVEPSIISLPSMRVITSVRNDSTSDPEGFWRWVQTKGLSFGKPGQHELFEFQTDTGDVFILRVADDFVNDGDYTDSTFDGGLFAALNVYLDEDFGERFHALVKDFDGNNYYQIDYRSNGSLHPSAMLENLISPDYQRELISLLVPVKKRIPNPELFDVPEEVTGTSIAEIEAANPILWEAVVPLDMMTQTHPQNSHFTINEDGEAEFIGWILRAVLSTHVSVKLPFRIDIEFRQSGEGRTGVIFYLGEDIEYHFGNDARNRRFGVNMSNDNEKMIQAIRFNQPIFLDDFHLPGRGAIKKEEINRLTWIVGETHLAVIVNNEIRYCGTNFPYMSLDLSREEAQPIVIGTDGNEKVCFKSIRVSQLAHTVKNKIKKEALVMITKQSNNIIPVIHRLVTDEFGENYWFNCCAKYVMECLGEHDYDYWFFAGLTGDIFTQHYSYTNLSSDSASGYLAEDNPARFYEDVFLKCGYAATFASGAEVLKNTEMYLQTLIAYIDKGIPVIRCGGSTGVFVGYEEYGKILLYITGNSSQPERIELNKVFESKPFHGYEYASGWIFVGDKKENRPLAEIYRKVINDIIPMQNIETDTYCFGPEAFRAWARDIESGKFDKMTADNFDTWCDYTNYVCVLATNGSCCHEFLNRARELNPDMGFIDEVSLLYKRIGEMWNNDNGMDLEALGGGFNVSLKTLQNKEKRDKIVSKIRDFADVTDEIVRIIKVNQQ